eukprot:85097-Chlamydomonas_euryale.AAC.2
MLQNITEKHNMAAAGGGLCGGMVGTGVTDSLTPGELSGCNTRGDCVALMRDARSRRNLIATNVTDSAICFHAAASFAA